MVPVDLRDHLIVERTSDPEITLTVESAPVQAIFAKRIRNSSQTLSVAHIPTDGKNLVVRALSEFRDQFAVQGGFRCRLLKRIPSGAGMGGASSDAASALLCVARLCKDEWMQAGEQTLRLHQIASSIGSDVPFFLGRCDDGSTNERDALVRRMSAARATGRGEKLTEVQAGSRLSFVIVYPKRELSTAEVYGRLKVPSNPTRSEAFLSAFSTGNDAEIRSLLFNRLTQPAREIMPQIDEILESMWRSGLQTCQLTGSGSACFAITNSYRQARRAAGQLRESFGSNAMVWAARAASVPSSVFGHRL